MLPRNHLRQGSGLAVPTLLAGGLMLTAAAALIGPGERREASEQRAELGSLEISLPAPDLPADIVLVELPPEDRFPVTGTIAALPEELSAPTGLIEGSVAPLAIWQDAPAADEPSVLPPQPPAIQVASLDPGAVQIDRLPEYHRPTSRPAPARAASAALSPTVLGKWVPDREACTNPEGSDYLPLQISASRASAGEAACRFAAPTRQGRTWSMLAECSDGTSEWTSKVSLAVAGGQLTWSSERGVQTYVRCEEEMRVAKRATKMQVASSRSPKKARVAARTKPAVMRITGDDGTVKTWALLKPR